MKIKRKAWILKNKGFTLIEMIVTVAIIAIFSGVVLTFIGTGTSVYRNTSSNSKVQMETQETFDKIEDLIIDANRSIYYASGSSNNLGNPITNDIKENSGDGTNSSENKIFIACNEYENNDGTSQYICDVLEWEKSEAKIYYSCKEYKAKSSNAGTAETSETEEFSDKSGENTAVVTSGQNVNVQNRKTLFNRSVLATGILDFRADVSKVKSDKIVRFQLSTENGKKQIQTLHSVSLRNNVDVKKPEEAFEKADAVDVKIKIINAPESMNPGESTLLAYTLVGGGSIDSTTIRWTVVENKDNGNFPSEDPGLGRLTINKNGSGNIVVQVSAVDSNTGKRIYSEIVTIKIKSSETTITPSPDVSPTPKNLIIKQNQNLIGAGQEYKLSDIVTSEMVYEGDKVKTDGYTLTWISTPEFITVDGDRLIVNPEAGKTEASGKVTLKAIDSESKLESNSITIGIARIDIQKPSGLYEVGNAKEWECVYKENGVKIETVTPTKNITEKPEGASDYFAQDGQVQGKFDETDVGSWKVTASVDLTARGGIGQVIANCNFTVKEADNAEILYAKNNTGSESNSLSAGGQYSCGFVNSNTAYLKINKGPVYEQNENCSIEYKIIGTPSDNTTRVEPASNGTYYILTIGQNEKGFLLSATINIWNNSSSSQIKTYRATKNIRVVQKDLVITSPPSIAIVGETYSLKVQAVVSYISDFSADGDEKYSTENINVDTENVYGKNITGDFYTVFPWTVAVSPGKKGKTNVNTQKIPGMLESGFGSWVTFYGKKDVTVMSRSE